MAQNYTAWPDQSDIEARLTNAGITPRSSISAGYYAQVADAIVAYITHKTHRQFLAGSAGEIRYFDGSGVGDQLVDEFVAITAVSVVGFIATGSLLSLTQVVSADTSTFPTNRLIIFQSSLPTQQNLWVNYFPRGRRNIKIAGTWGYGQYIPDDVWWAACGRMAALIAAETSIPGASGRIRKWIEGDASEELNLDLPGEVAGWDAGFKEMLRTYKRPMSQRGRRRPSMI